MISRFYFKHITRSNLESIETIIDNQIAAYNSRKFEEFMGSYSKDVKVVSNIGKTKLEMSFSEFSQKVRQLFDCSPGLHCKIEKRIHLGSYIVDHEIVSGIAGNPNPVQSIVTYQLNNSKIQNVWFFSDE